MNIGTHIPSYLLCERFVKKGKILDLFPDDKRGCEFLAAQANQFIVVADKSSQDIGQGSPELTTVVAKLSGLPFAHGSFDFVLSLVPGRITCITDLSDLLKIIQPLLRPAGVFAVMLPNRESAEGRAWDKRELPDFLEYEQTLRRQYPHVAIFGQSPLYGAVLSPVGRRFKSDEPLLDNRTIPEEGETPSHFIALCSAKYRQWDDTIISQLPYEIISGSFRVEVERLNDAIGLLRKENAAHISYIDNLKESLDDKNSSLAKTQQLQGRIDALAKEKENLNRQISFKTEQIQKAEEQISDFIEKYHAQESALSAAHLVQKNTEQQLKDVSYRNELLTQQMDNGEKERQLLITDIDAAQDAIKEHERHIGRLQTEIGHLTQEIAEQKKQIDAHLSELRESNTVVNELKREAVTLEEYKKTVHSHLLEVQRTRELLDSERAHFEQSIEKEHALVLSEINLKESYRQKAHAAEKRLKELEIELAQNRRQVQELSDAAVALNEEARVVQANKLAFEQEQQSLNKEITTLRQALEKQSGLKADAERQNALLQSELSHNIEIKEDLQATLERQTEQNEKQQSELNQSIVALQKSKNEQAEALSKLEIQAELYAGELKQYQSANEKLQEKLDSQMQSAREDKQTLSDAIVALETEKNELNEQLVDLKYQNESLTKQVEAYSSTIEKLEKSLAVQTERFAEEKDAFAAAISALETEKSELNEQLNDLKQDNAQLTNEVGEYSAANEKLEKSLAFQVESVGEEKQALTDAIAALKQEKHALNLELSDLKIKNEQLTDDLEQTDAANEKLKAAFDLQSENVDKQTSDLSKTVAGLQTEKNDLAVQLSEMQSRAEKLDADLKQSEAAVAHLQATLDERDAKAKALSASLNESIEILQKDKNELTVKNSELKIKNEQLIYDVEHYSVANKQLQASLAKQSQSVDEQNETLAASIAALQKERNGLSLQNSELKIGTEQLANELKGQEALNAKLQTRLDLESQSFEEVNEKWILAQKENNENKRTIGLLTTDIEKQKDDLARSKTLYQQLSEEAESLKTERNRAHGSLAEMEKNLLETQDRLSHFENEARKAVLLETELASAYNEIEALKQETSGVKATADDLTAARQAEESAAAALTEANAENEALKKTLAFAEKNSASLQKQLNDLQKLSMNIQTELQETQNAKRVISAELSALGQKYDALEQKGAEMKHQLADSLERGGQEDSKYIDQIKSMKKEMHRLRDENENELLLVRQDLETELRYSNQLLDARNNEIWELRETIVRLQAQAAASAADAENQGVANSLTDRLAEQESLIAKMTSEREQHNKLLEAQAHSLEARKKNLKILALILKKERQLKRENRENEAAFAFDENVNEGSSRSSGTVTGGPAQPVSKGGAASDLSLSRRKQSIVPDTFAANDDEELDAIMDSVLFRAQSDDDFDLDDEEDTQTFDLSKLSKTTKPS